MRGTVSLVLLACAAAALSQPTTVLSDTAGTFTIGANSYTTNTSGLAGSTNFEPANSGDHAFRQAWLYRQGGDTREYNVTSPTTTFNPGTNTWDCTMFKGPGNSDTGTPNLKIEASYILTSPGPNTPLLEAHLCITNISNAPVFVSAFYYGDFDIPNGFVQNHLDDFLTLPTSNPFNPRISDSVDPSYFMESYAVGAVRFQHGLPYDNQLTNTTFEDLNNSISGFNGDMVIGYQWECWVDPGMCCEGAVFTRLGAPVPEPASVIVICAGLLALGRKRRNR